MIREIDLLSYLPAYLKKYKELVAALLAQNEEIEKIWKEAERILNNRFLETADRTGLERFERLMKLDSYGQIEERRFRCRAKWNEQKNYTPAWLRSQLDYLCGEDGYNLSIVAEKYLLVIQVALKSKNNVVSIRDMLARIMPANMLWDVTLLYNQHVTLQPYTHGELSKYTYSKLRNEVLTNA